MIAIFILVVLTSTLVFTIVDDWRNYRIHNATIVILLALFALNVWNRGGPYGPLAAQVVIALLMFGVLFFLFTRGLMGGGDVKLLPIALLWMGGDEATLFTLLMAALVIVYYVAARLGLAPSRGKSRVFIPFAPCISGAWLLTLALTRASAIL